MSTILIRENQATDTGFAAILSFDNQTQYPITIQDPFDRRQERELEFYFEQWIRFPFDNQVLAQRAAASVTAYGESLFEQVFRHDPDAYSNYHNACQGGLSNLRIEIEGNSPGFQALHWEALKDPKQPRPFAVEGVFTRKRFHQGVTPIALQPSPVINLLVVTARPDEEKDVGYRTISRPLIEAIHQAQLRVNVEVLRPGTFEALSKHLDGKEGHYHIIHFDAHGGLMTYDQFQQGAQADRYTFQARYGRQDIERYDGVKAFLFLEGETKGKADPVEAQELAALLTSQGIPICILNACQSGKQVKADDRTQNAEGKPPEDNPTIQNPKSKIQNTETSLGSRLMAAGVQMVVAMGYSVTVTAAALMMKTLYSQLFAQKGIPDAIRLGRRELYNQKNRRVYFNQIVDLEDWLLPVVYANREVDLRLRDFEPREKAEYLVQRRQQYRFTGATYGFVGRDLEILKIEKALLRHNILLLRGMGGTGKTTLLNYLRDWWQTTNFVKEVFYFGYDESAHTLQQILRVVGKGLYSDPYEFAGFEAMPIEAQMEDLAEKLRAHPYGLMLDNLESVTGQALSIQNTLPEAEQNAIREFLRLLRGGQTKVVLGSRSGEEWLADAFTQAGKANVYQLEGLDPESRTVLAEKILEAQVNDPQRIATLRTEEDFQRLMKLLAGYPLAMEVVLANLARQSPQEVLAALNAADVNLAGGLNPGGEDRTNNILKCVEYSHSNLSPEAQQLLVCLAPFNSFIDRAGLESYGTRLKQLEPFEDYDFGRFDDAVQEAIQWGLLSPMSTETPRFLTIQPIFPYFLRTKLNNLDAATRDALYDGFKAHYKGLAGSYQQLMNSQDPNQQQLGLLFCRLEYENLYNALRICLEQQISIAPVFFCIQDFLELSQNPQLGLQVSEFVLRGLDQYPASSNKGKIGDELGMVYQRIGSSYQELQDYAQASIYYQKSLKVYEALEDMQRDRKGHVLGVLNHQLGIVAQALREFEQARSHYQQALDICIEYNDRYSQARTYHQLGIVAEELREYAQARSHYQQALDIFIEFNDRHSQAATYHNLGSVAQALREFEQARSHYQQALDICIEYNDRYSQASTYHQLGIVAEELREYAQARSHYQQALDIYIEYNDRYNQADTYHQLGIVAQALREYEQARSHYQQALDIDIEYNDRYSQARTYHQLGIVAEELREYEQARSHYQQALDIYIEYNDRYRQAHTYHQLGSVAEELREYEQARSHYQQALTIFAEFGDEHNGRIVLGSFARLYQATQDEGIVVDVAQCLNETPEAVKRLFENLTDG
ncbi:MAG: tetratricopeptide repeat protein [Cyanobacteria bacterium J06638_20]